MTARRRTHAQAFRQTFPDAGDLLVVRAPGRINLLGGHTDYNDGYVLPAAVDRYLYVSAAARSDDLLHVRSLALGEEARLHTRPDATDVPPWARSIHGMAVELRERGESRPGADCLLWGNLPLGSGLSSSAALEIAIGMALCRLSGSECDRVELARLGQHVEHTYMGVRCGIMDQVAVALSREGTAMLLDCRSLDRRFVPLGSIRLVVCHSGTRRNLAVSEYNRRRLECEEAVRRLHGFRPGIRSLRDVGPEDLPEATAYLDSVLARRVRHVVGEIDRVIRASEALASEDYATFGQLIFASHESLRDLYEVSSPELDLLVEIAREVSGVYGCRLTGAGFGGAVLAVATQQGAAELVDRVLRSYPSKTGLEPQTFLCQASGAACGLSADEAEEAWQRSV
jgi:galactokinase